MHLIVTDSFVNFCSTIKLILDPPLKIIENNTMCSVQEHLRWFSCLAKVILAIFTWPVFSVIYLLIFFYVYRFHSLNTLQYHIIYHIHSHNYSDSKKILYHTHLYQLIHCIHICIYLFSIFVYYDKHLHLICIYIYKFSAILCVLFLDIRLSALIFVSLAARGTQNFAYGSLILLQLPLHLFFNTVRIKLRFLTVDVYDLWSNFTFLIARWNRF